MQEEEEAKLQSSISSLDESTKTAENLTQKAHENFSLLIPHEMRAIHQIESEYW